MQANQNTEPLEGKEQFQLSDDEEEEEAKVRQPPQNKKFSQGFFHLAQCLVKEKPTIPSLDNLGWDHGRATRTKTRDSILLQSQNRTQEEKKAIKSRIDELVSCISYDTLVLLKGAIKRKEESSILLKEAVSVSESSSSSDADNVIEEDPFESQSESYLSSQANLVEQKVNNNLPTHNSKSILHAINTQNNLKVHMERMQNGTYAYAEKESEAIERFKVTTQPAEHYTGVLLKSLQKTYAQEEQENDQFVKQGKLIPGPWLKDSRNLLKGHRESSKMQIQEELQWRSSVHLAKFGAFKNNVTNLESSSPPKPPEEGFKPTKYVRQVMRRFSIAPSQNNVDAKDLLVKDKGRALSPDLMALSEGDQQSSVSSSVTSRSNTESKDTSHREFKYSATETSGVLTEEILDDSKELEFYKKIVDEREKRVNHSTLRFNHNNSGYKRFGSEFAKLQEQSRWAQCRELCRSAQMKRNQFQIADVPFSQQSPERRKERLAYLRYRMKVASFAILFLHLIKTVVKESNENEMSRRHYEVQVDERIQIIKSETKANLFIKIKMLWHIIASAALWFNLITSPFVMMWPEMSSKEDHLFLYYAFWLNELIWVLDIVRKIFDKPKKSRADDIYENAILYIKSTLILDLVASLPQLASGLNPKFVPLKIIRIYQIWLLHYPLEEIVQMFYSQSDQRIVYVLVYACMTLCRIMLLLHYLAVVWLFIGSDYFIDYEPGYLPWQLSNSDFEEYSSYKLYVFSGYWVCTVVTTVGYGDYAGGTSLEYLFTVTLELMGIVVFSVLQVAVLQVVQHDSTYESYFINKTDELNVWLMVLEKSNFPKSIPADLYQEIKHRLHCSFQSDFNLITEEFDFYQKLSPAMQQKLVSTIFSSFIFRFRDFFNGCEQQFTSNLVMSLSYNFYEHGYTIQSARYDVTDIYMISRGGIAVCEPTCFNEPVLVYGQGTVINLYQVLMNKRIALEYKTVSPSSFSVSEFGAILYNQNDVEYLRKQRGKLESDADAKDIIEIYSIEKDKFIDLCDLFPKTASLVQRYCISQVEFLSETRQKRDHLHSGNEASVRYRKNERFFEKRLNKEMDLSIQVQQLNSQQIQSHIDKMIADLQDQVDDLDFEMRRKMQQLIWKVTTNHRRLDSSRLNSGSFGTGTFGSGNLVSSNFGSSRKMKNKTSNKRLSAFAKRQNQSSSDSLTTDSSFEGSSGESQRIKPIDKKVVGCPDCSPKNKLWSTQLELEVEEVLRKDRRHSKLRQQECHCNMDKTRQQSGINKAKKSKEDDMFEDSAGENKTSEVMLIQTSTTNSNSTGDFQRDEESHLKPFSVFDRPTKNPLSQQPFFNHPLALTKLSFELVKEDRKENEEDSDQNKKSPGYENIFHDSYRQSKRDKYKKDHTLQKQGSKLHQRNSSVDQNEVQAAQVQTTFYQELGAGLDILTASFASNNPADPDLDSSETETQKVTEDSASSVRDVSTPQGKTRHAFYKQKMSGFNQEHSVIIVSQTNVSEAQDGDPENQEKQSDSKHEEVELFVDDKEEEQKEEVSLPTPVVEKKEQGSSLASLSDDGFYSNEM